MLNCRFWKLQGTKLGKKCSKWPNFDISNIFNFFERSKFKNVKSHRTSYTSIKRYRLVTDLKTVGDMLRSRFWKLQAIQFAKSAKNGHLDISVLSTFFECSNSKKSKTSPNILYINLKILDYYYT